MRSPEDRVCCFCVGSLVMCLRLVWLKETVPTVGGGPCGRPLPERLLPWCRSAGKTGFECDALGTHFRKECSSQSPGVIWTRPFSKAALGTIKWGQDHFIFMMTWTHRMDHSGQHFSKGSSKSFMKVAPFLICGFYKDKTSSYIINYIPQVHCLWIYVHFLLFSELKQFHFKFK